MYKGLQATVPQLVCLKFQIFLLADQGLNLLAKKEPERKWEVDILKWLVQISHFK